MTRGQPFEERRAALVAKLRMLLLFQQGHNTAEIARRMGTSEAHVYNTLGARQVCIQQAIENTRLSLRKQRQKEWRKAA